MESQVLDFLREDRIYFKAPIEPEIVEFGKKNYLSLEGRGSPENEIYQKSIEAIFSSAFFLKFYHKKKGNNFKVSKLECLWWVDEGKDFSNTPMEEWHWKLLIRIPDYITMEEVSEGASKMKVEKELDEVSRIGLISLEEGKCVQVMHIGSYNKVGETYDKLLKFINISRLEPNGPYHEIYISDPGRTPPEKLKTIVRQPVRSARN